MFNTFSDRHSQNLAYKRPVSGFYASKAVVPCLKIGQFEAVSSVNSLQTKELGLKGIGKID